MRFGVFRKTEWEEVDRILRAEAKRVLFVPQEANNGYLYGSLKDGLVGIPVLAETSDAALVDSAFKLLTSRDPILRGLASAHLDATVERRVRDVPTADWRGRYLRGDNGAPFRGGQDEVATVWSRARSASTRLGVEWRFVGREPELRVGDDTVGPDKRRQVMAAIRAFYDARRLRTLLALRSQGKAIEPVVADPVASSHFMREGRYTRFADWRFVHRARLNLVPLNANSHREDADRSCRRCGYPLESLPHVINHCMRNSAAYKLRHDAVLARVEQAAAARCETLYRDRVVPGTALRPDLVIRRDGEIHVVDVAIPFENRSTALDAARRGKLDKYAPLVDVLRQRFGARSVTIEAVVVGSLGAWHKQNDPFLGRLCSRAYLRTMKRLIVSDTVRWSRDVYVEHLSGRRQYAGGGRSSDEDDGDDPGGAPAPRSPEPEEARHRSLAPSPPPPPRAAIDARAIADAESA